MTEDTIAAIATPLGEGGLAVVRISGPRALAVADGCFVPAGRASSRPSAAKSHTLHFGHATLKGRTVDEVLLAVMRAPRTFTREDVVEISCHGGEPAPHTKAQFWGRMDAAAAAMDRLLATANEGQILRRGIRAAIIGRPNAGKSSLLNQLLGCDRAIVSPVPGTTRDTIEETANIRGLPVVFVDTAGARQARAQI